jgi:hypothetical protein
MQSPSHDKRWRRWQWRDIRAAIQRQGREPVHQIRHCRMIAVDGHASRRVDLDDVDRD